MPTRAQAQNLARRLHGLASHPEIARKAAARELSERDPLEATELIHHLLVLAREGSEPAHCVLATFITALQHEAAQLPAAASLRRLARIQAFDAVAALFPDSAPLQELDQRAAAKADAKAFSDSLGHLKTKARLTRDPDELSRIAMMSDASVVKNALMNPRITEPLVVRMAARRPARPEPLLEIWKSPRWSARHAVRRALVFNPYLPPDVSAKILPLLTRVDLEEIARSGSMHPDLREQAARLLKPGELDPTL